MLSTGGMLDFARDSEADDVHRRHRDGHAAPAAQGEPRQVVHRRQRAAACRYMKMITLPKLRDALRDLAPEVKVDPELAERARVPIERMVAIGP